MAFLRKFVFDALKFLGCCHVFLSFPHGSLSLIPPFSSSSLAQIGFLPFLLGLFLLSVMESHQRQIHFHLARAIMHLSYIAGFLPLVEPDLDWDSSPMLSGPSMPLAPSNFSTGSRNLHTFVPMLRSNHHATLLSHGGLPSHMTINPEPNLHPMRSSISMATVAEEVYPAARPISSSSTEPPATRSTSASTPTAPPVRSRSSATPPTHHSGNPSHPKRRCLQPPGTYRRWQPTPCGSPPTLSQPPPTNFMLSCKNSFASSLLFSLVFCAAFSFNSI